MKTTAYNMTEAQPFDAPNRIPHLNLRQRLTPWAIDQWIIRLWQADLLYHFDDDPYDVGNSDGYKWVRTFTDTEAATLVNYLAAVRDVENYDPFDIAVDLVNGLYDPTTGAKL